MPDEFLPTPPAAPEPTLPGFEAPAAGYVPAPSIAPPVTVGRIVHYYDGHGFGPYAAIVTGVQEGGRADLTIFRSGTAHPDWDVAVPFAPSKVEFGPIWTWPPRA